MKKPFNRRTADEDLVSRKLPEQKDRLKKYRHHIHELMYDEDDESDDEDLDDVIDDLDFQWSDEEY